MVQYKSFGTCALGALAALAFGGRAEAQTFQFNTANIPQGNPFNNSRSENVDFGDVERDGDWDAIFGDGGDTDQDQDRIWINMGNLQGGTTGVFQDQTSTRFPAILDQTRDIEFADIDQDGDIDIYVSNTSQIIAQTNRWFANMGGIQAGTEGFFTDQTAARWVNLNSPSSSIPNSAILGGGGFKDWSCDCDFGDLDNDGDLDLVHSSYGGAFGGNVPTRIFLNDGTGKFSDFNPSGFKLPVDQIANGNPGLWCQGTQSANTTNSTGTNCDISSSALDIDVGDIDGDLDLDILHGARQEVPRMFKNRLQENGGTTLAFRDVTGATFPAGYSVGNGHYDQQLHDMDGDFDLDIYGLNWQVSGGFNDVTLRNATGAGVYDQTTVLSGSGSDDNEGDFLDYDNDGDLDLLIANFSGQERLYRNNNNGGATFSYTNVTSGGLPGDGSTSLDADTCDVDMDGDYDAFVANDFGAANTYLRNISGGGPDTRAPMLSKLEQAPNRFASGIPTTVRVQVYDNASYYITWYNDTTLEYRLNAGAWTPVAMQSSQGQIFRGEIPGTLVGTIDYRVTSTDEYGNTTTSALKTYTASNALGTAYCFGTSCPCGNNDPTAGCANSTGSGALLSATAGSASVSANDLVLTAIDVAPNNFGIVFMGDTQVNNPLGDGRVCAGGNTFRFPASNSGPGGILTLTGPAGSSGGMITGGSTWNFQAWYRDIPGPCATGFNLSNGLSIGFTP
jgi:hypothetical protein